MYARHIAPLTYYWPINGLGGGGSYLHRQDWQVNTRAGSARRHFGRANDRSIGRYNLQEMACNEIAKLDLFKIDADYRDRLVVIDMENTFSVFKLC